mmetsp:Transcript_119398/g.334459  ORF Transcript_119398/g.334459 Transcript_119398/m.334459 type:complete len:229 (+) Transcript_119398:81-767(+)
MHLRAQQSLCLRKGHGPGRRRGRMQRPVTSTLSLHLVVPDHGAPDGPRTSSRRRGGRRCATGQSLVGAAAATEFEGPKIVHSAAAGRRCLRAAPRRKHVLLLLLLLLLRLLQRLLLHLLRLLQRDLYCAQRFPWTCDHRRSAELRRTGLRAEGVLAEGILPARLRRGGLDLEERHRRRARRHKGGRALADGDVHPGRAAHKRAFALLESDVGVAPRSRLKRNPVFHRA